MTAHSIDSSRLENAGRRQATMRGSERLVDEGAMVETLLVCGLGGRHEVGVDFSASLRSCSTNYLREQISLPDGQVK